MNGLNIDPVLSNFVNLIEKVSIIIFFRNSKGFKAIFLLEIRTMIFFFEKQVSFLSVHLRA